MNAITPQVAEARATALVLRATARAIRAEQGALYVRLNRAADVLDTMVALVVRCLDRIEQLQQALRIAQAGGQ
jgi:hypothetical protein